MKKINYLFTALIPVTLLTILLLSGCSKTGPQGPIGTTGASGATGAAGPAGPQGPAGNADVQVDTFTVVNAQWAWNSQYAFQTSVSSFTEYFTRYYNASFSKITQSILNTGQVMVYFTPNTSNNTNQWAPLPYQFTDGSGNFNYEFAFETNVGTVRLHFFFVQLVASATIPTLSTYILPAYKFKIVAISGTISTGLKNAHVDVNDYNAVSRYLGI